MADVFNGARAPHAPNVFDAPHAAAWAGRDVWRKRSACGGNGARSVAGVRPPHPRHRALVRCLLAVGFALVGHTTQAQMQTAPVAAATAEQTAPAAAGETVNRIGMRFVRIPAGSFLMGSAADDARAFAVEKPQHRVIISRPFEIGQYEVTQAEWEAVMGHNPYTLDRSNPYYNLPGMARRITRPEHPATVSWEDAQRFIARLNALENTRRYRLPTEAEWEYAARAGTNTAYSFGEDAAALDAHA